MKIGIIKADERHREDINRLIRGAKIGSGIKIPLKYFWVVKNEGRIIACAGLDFHGKNVAVLTHLVVHKRFRHKGIGSALTHHRIRMARKNGARTVALVTMYYLFRFYKKRGFKTCKRAELPENVRNYWMFTVDRYKKCAVMTRKLKSG